MTIYTFINDEALRVPYLRDGETDQRTRDEDGALLVQAIRVEADSLEEAREKFERMATDDD